MLDLLPSSGKKEGQKPQLLGRLVELASELKELSCKIHYLASVTKLPTFYSKTRHFEAGHCPPPNVIFSFKPQIQCKKSCRFLSKKRMFHNGTNRRKAISRNLLPF
jgi:hypothetical protein